MRIQSSTSVFGASGAVVFMGSIVPVDESALQEAVAPGREVRRRSATDSQPHLFSALLTLILLAHGAAQVKRAAAHRFVGTRPHPKAGRDGGLTGHGAGARGRHDAD